MTAAIDVLRKSMIQNFVCLEFNKDLHVLQEKLQMENSDIEGVQFVLKEIADLQNEHNIFTKVIPESKGGPTTWDNLVACCQTCQCKKADKYTYECNMYPINKPKSPTFEERFFNAIKISNSIERKTWLKGLKKLGLLHIVERM